MANDEAVPSPRAWSQRRLLVVPLARAVAGGVAGIAAFSPDAQRYLLSLLIFSVANGAYALIFNLYLLDLGYDTAFLGGVLAFSSLAVAVFSLPVGMLTDRLGRGRTMMVSELVIGVGVIGQALFPGPVQLYALAFVLGAGLAGYGVVYGPFLTESSTPRDRLQLFSFATILAFAGASVGQIAGAFLPNAVPAGPSLADRYRVTLVLSGLVAMAAMAPMLRVRAAGGQSTRPRLGDVLRDIRGITGQLLVIHVFLGLQYGLTYPFFNLFFVQQLQASREEYGLISSLAIVPSVLGPLLSPAIGRRWGTLAGALVTRTLMGTSILALALAPTAGAGAVALWLRSFIMALAVPLLDSFLMERIDPRARASIAGLLVIGWYLAATVGTAAAGWLIAGWGYQPPFLIAVGLHVAMGAVCWWFFGQPARERRKMEG
ncbi:MAG: MFS transporter [Chloroflexi bacterium]|nr:MFS transporter [Chloroflexota bacterium]